MIGHDTPAGRLFAVILGDAAKPAPIAMGVKLPPGYPLSPYRWRNEQHIGVLAGTLQVSAGSAFDEKAMHASRSRDLHSTLPKPKKDEHGIGALQRDFTARREYYDRNASGRTRLLTQGSAPRPTRAKEERQLLADSARAHPIGWSRVLIVRV